MVMKGPVCISFTKAINIQTLSFLKCNILRSKSMYSDFIRCQAESRILYSCLAMIALFIPGLTASFELFKRITAL